MLAKNANRTYFQNGIPSIKNGFNLLNYNFSHIFFNMTVKHLCGAYDIVEHHLNLSVKYRYLVNVYHINSFRCSYINNNKVLI